MSKKWELASAFAVENLCGLGVRIGQAYRLPSCPAFMVRAAIAAIGMVALSVGFALRS